MKAIFFKAIVKKGQRLLDDDDECGAAGQTPPPKRPKAPKQAVVADTNPQAADGPETNPPADNPGPNDNADDPGAPRGEDGAAKDSADNPDAGADSGLSGLLRLLQDVPDDGSDEAPGAGDEPSAEFGPDSVAEGDHVAFHAGEFKGAGKVHAVGEDGVTVADGAGRKHQVHWHEVKGIHGKKGNGK